MTDDTLIQGATAHYAATVANQRRAADPARSVWASANAGAGKTKVLIDRIARLLLSGAAPEQILAVTYTKAAAAEMQTRLFETLGQWTVASDNELVGALADLEPDVVADAGRLKVARRLFARALEAPGGLQIQTIHSFCTAILQRFPLEAGLTPGFRVLDEIETGQLQARALELAMQGAPQHFSVLIARLDEEALGKQLDAALHTLTTHGATTRDAEHAYERACAALGVAEGFDGLSAWSAILEGGAIGILSEAMASLSAAKLSDPERKTLERLGQVVEAIRAGDTPEEGDHPWSGLLSLALTEKRQPRVAPFFNMSNARLPPVRAMLGGPQDDGWPGGLIKQVLDLDGQMRALELARWSQALAGAAFERAAAFARLKQATGALDFNDLLARTAGLLRGGEGAARWVLFKLDAGIGHVLIDEAQDTSPDQWDLFAPLLEALDEEERDTPRTRFVVGDAKQSIYSFQGAKPERFEQEQAAFLAGGAGLPVAREVLDFGLSFRTGQTILDAVDAVWSVCGPKSASGHSAALDGEASPPEAKFLFPRRHFANRQSRPGVVEVWPPEPRFRLADGRDLESEDEGLPLDAEREWAPSSGLAERIARELKARIGTDMVCDKSDAPRPMTPDDVMILLPSRGPLFYQIIKRLKAAAIPVAGVDRINLPSELAVQDLLALGRFALTPLDDFNLACVLKGPFCGLVDDQADLWPLAHGRGETSLWDVLCARAAERPDWAAAHRLLMEMSGLGGDRGPYAFYAALLEQEWICADGLSRTGWQLLIGRLGREVREPVELFLARALDHGTNAPPGLMTFIQTIASDTTSIKRELEKGASGVRVMTVHGAKGLEAPVVILPEMTKSTQDRAGRICWDSTHAVLLAAPDSKAVLPALAALKDEVGEAARAEKARLLYVAMTRARDHLILCTPASGRAGKESWNEGRLPDGTAIEISTFVAPEDSWWAWVGRGLDLLKGSGIAGVPSSRPLATVDGHPDLQAEVYGSAPVADGRLAGQPATGTPDIPEWVTRPVRTELWTGPALVRRLSPSRLLDDDDTPPSSSPSGAAASARFLRGRLIHTLLQQLPDHPPETHKPLARARLAREPLLDDAARDEITAQVVGVLQDPAFAAVFGPGSRAEVQIAGHGPGLPAGVVINGSIDRLVVRDDEVLVLDFKTNRPPPRTVETVARSYLVQMAAYRALITATWPDRRVRTALLWTDVPALMELPDALLDSVLRSLQDGT